MHAIIISTLFIFSRNIETCSIEVSDFKLFKHYGKGAFH